MKRELNPFMKDLINLKAFIKTKVDDPKTLNNVGAMSSAASTLLKNNDRDLDKAKKNFKATAFMRDYNVAKTKIEKNRAEKQALKKLDV